MIRSMAVVAVIHYLWLMFCSSVVVATTPSNPDGQLESSNTLRHHKHGRQVGSQGWASRKSVKRR